MGEEKTVGNIKSLGLKLGNVKENDHSILSRKGAVKRTFDNDTKQKIKFFKHLHILANMN